MRGQKGVRRRRPVPELDFFHVNSVEVQLHEHLDLCAASHTNELALQVKLLVNYLSELATVHRP